MSSISDSFRCWWSHHSLGHAASHGCCHLPGAGKDSWEEKWWGGTTQNTVHATRFKVSMFSFWHDNFYVSPQLGAIGSLHWSMAFLKWAGCGRSFGRIGWSRCWTLGTGCSGHWAWSSSSDRIPAVDERHESNETYIVPYGIFSIVRWLLHSVKLIKPLKMDEKRWLKDCFPSGKAYFQ